MEERYPLTPEIDCACGHESHQHFGEEGYGCIDCPREYCIGNSGRIPNGWDEYVASELA